MAKEQLPHIDVRGIPELERLAEQVQRANRPALLTRDQTVLARVSPARPRRRLARSSTSRVDDSLLRLIGIAAGPDDGVHDAAEQHDTYLADAAADPQV